MNNKAVNFLKNFSYTLSSNLISVVISTIVILIVPKIIGVEGYGYWQLYLFYSSYVGLLHFGWNDGIYLRYGGKHYEELDKRLFFSQFWMLAILQLILVIFIMGMSTIFINDPNRLFIFKMLALNLLIVNLNCMLVYILQSTNRIKEYAQITMMEKVFYTLLIILLLILNIREYTIMIMADLIGKLISFLYSMYCCKDIVFRKVSSFYLNIKEAIKSINAGIKLMFANIASSLIIGIVRFGIERIWDVSTFGKVSLTLSISNLMMIFINAMGIIIFPLLRRIETQKLPSIYITIRTLLMMLLIGALIVYYPLKFILSAWLPQYAESLIYMALVFPICIYEGKISLLIYTFLKSLRKEKFILLINIISVILSLITTFIFAFVLKNLSLSIAAIVFLLAFRCTLAEMFLSKILNISLYKDSTLEILITLVFILTGWFVVSWLGIIIYLLAYILYLFIKRKDIITMIKRIKNLAKE